MLRTVFDIPALKARQKDLEQIAAQPDFWNDQKNAQMTMRQLDEVKDQLGQFNFKNVALRIQFVQDIEINSCFYDDDD